MRRNGERLPARRSQEWELTPGNEGDWLQPSSIFSSSPWQMMRRMQEDMDRLFDQVWGGGGRQGTLAGPSAAAGMQWAPSIDVSQTDREWCIEADLPGVNKDDINVQVQDHHLILTAELNQEEQPEGGNGQQQRQYQRRERRYGFFQRVVPLPENTNEEEISCDFRNGVLAVHIPKTEQSRQGARRIPVYAADELPSETATGRQRTRREMEMTEGEEAESEMSMAGSKGGETTSRRTATKDTGPAPTEAESKPARSKSGGSRSGKKPEG